MESCEHGMPYRYICSVCDMGAEGCPDCGQDAIEESIEMISFLVDKGRVELYAAVPVMRCLSCRFSYTDYRAEEIKDGVYKKYIEVVEICDDDLM